VLLESNLKSLNIIKLIKNFQMSTNYVNIKSNNSLDYISDFEEGIRLFQLKQFDQSIAIFDRLIKQDPINSELHHLRGILALYNNDLTLAIKAFSSAIEINSNNEFYFNNLGITLKKSGKFIEAVINFDKALSLNNSFFEALNNKANTLCELGRFKEAIESYQIATKLNPNFSDGYFNLGNAHKALKNNNEAINNFKIAIKLNNKHYEALTALGSLECDLEDYKSSIVNHNKSINLNPNYAIAHNNLGITYLKLNDFVKAKKFFEKAIELNPVFADAQSNLGLTFLNLNKLSDAIQCFENAILHDQYHADALNNFGNALIMLKDYKKALECFDLAIASDKNHFANFNKAFVLLLLGNYKEAWNSYEFRLNDKKNISINFLHDEKRLTKLSNLRDKKVLICHEQGLGDSIQFIRFAKSLKDLGAHILVLAPKELTGLFSSIDHIDRIITLDSSLPEYDFHIPVASLPLLFETTLSSIPSAEGYLSVKKDKYNNWANRLGAKSKPRIGLAWSSTSKFKDDANRSMPLSQFIKYLDFDKYEFISLQKFIKEEDKSLFKKLHKIKHYGNDLLDFSDTAALANCLDLVITTCTSIPHLTGGLGIKTSLLLQYNADWRWLIDRADSPWYKSIKIYRQSEYRNWDPVLRKVSNDLESLLNNYAGHLKTPPHFCSGV
jgi:tetratricopeptide (TPR) repeat protein